MSALVHYDVACRELAAATKIDEVKAIKDKAEAMEVYGRLAKNVALEKDAMAIRARATRRIGELMEEMKKTGQRQPKDGSYRKNDSLKINESKKPTLQALGIDSNLAHAARTAAKMPEKEFEASLAKKKQELEQRRVVQITKPRKSGARKAPVLPDIDVFLDQLTGAYQDMPPPNFVTQTEALLRAVEDAVNLNQEKLASLVKSMRGASARIDNYADRLSAHLSATANKSNIHQLPARRFK